MMALPASTPLPLHGIELRHDRRCRPGNFVPDSKTKRFYRVHPDTVQRMKLHLFRKEDALPYSMVYQAKALQLNPPILLGGIA